MKKLQGTLATDLPDPVNALDARDGVVTVIRDFTAPPTVRVLCYRGVRYRVVAAS